MTRRLPCTLKPSAPWPQPTLLCKLVREQRLIDCQRCPQSEGFVSPGHSWLLSGSPVTRSARCPEQTCQLCCSDSPAGKLGNLLFPHLFSQEFILRFALRAAEPSPAAGSHTRLSRLRRQKPRCSREGTRGCAWWLVSPCPPRGPWGPVLQPGLCLGSCLPATAPHELGLPRGWDRTGQDGMGQGGTRWDRAGWDGTGLALCPEMPQCTGTGDVPRAAPASEPARTQLCHMSLLCHFAFSATLWASLLPGLFSGILRFPGFGSWQCSPPRCPQPRTAPCRQLVSPSLLPDRRTDSGAGTHLPSCSPLFFYPPFFRLPPLALGDGL